MATATKPSPWQKPEGRERERIEKREAVLATAVRAFNELGFHRTSLDDVATALNVTKPTIYHYFSTKDEILFECVRRGLERIREATETGQAGDGNGLQRLRALLLNYAMVMTMDFGMCVIRTADHELSADSRAKFRALKREIDQTIRRVMASGMEDGSIEPGDVRMMTFTVTGALNWIARWYDPEGSIAAEDVAAQTVDNLIRGLAPRQN